MTAPAVIRQPEVKRVRASERDTGVIYFLANMNRSTVKVGYTTNLSKRGSVLQTGNQDRLEVCCFIKAHRSVENLIHAALKAYGILNEWFDHDACVDDLIRKIEEYEIERGLQSGDFSPIVSQDDLQTILLRWRSDALPGDSE